MERYIYIGPAIVALIIFIYMRNRQEARRERMRERQLKREETLMELLAAKEPDKNEEAEDAKP